MNRSRTRVKICGLMRLEDVAYVNEYQPEYAGFVFAESRRKVDGEWVKGLRLFLDPQIQAAGVFVNEKPETILTLCDSKTIDVIQLHGDEDEAYMEYLKKRISNPVIKAIRVQNQSQIEEAQRWPCDYLLLDTYTKGQYGGSGQEFDLSLIPQMQKPFFLAGGLSADNVRAKIDTCHPYAVDISSGVEGADGWKDINKIRKFIERVREEK